jgi:hypothetical protein
MRKTLLAAGLAGGIAALSCQNAGAVPANAVAIQEAAMNASVMQRVQYAERRTRHGVVKCYRDLSSVRTAATIIPDRSEVRMAG